MGYIAQLRQLVGHRPLIMPCACLVVGDGRGNVLLQRRADDGNWANHGGAVELDESVEDALLREIREELGVEPVSPALLGVYSGPECRHVYPNGDEVSVVDIVYWCEALRGTPRLQPEEVTDLRWFPGDKLPANLMPHNRRPISDYLSLRGFPGTSE